DQGESRNQAVPTSRSISRVVRVAVADGHPQPPETPPTQAGHHLKENRRFWILTRRPLGGVFMPGANFVRQPPRRAKACGVEVSPMKPDALGAFERALE